MTGNQLKIEIKKLGLTQEKAAEMLGIHRATLVSWMNKAKLDDSTLQIVYSKLHIKELDQNSDVVIINRSDYDLLLTKAESATYLQEKLSIEKEISAGLRLSLMKATPPVVPSLVTRVVETSNGKDNPMRHPVIRKDAIKLLGLEFITSIIAEKGGYYIYHDDRMIKELQESTSDWFPSEPNDPDDGYNIFADEYIHTFIRECISLGIFNKEMYEKYNILTSLRIQALWLIALTRMNKSNDVYYVNSDYIVNDGSAEATMVRRKLCILTHSNQITTDKRFAVDYK